MVHTWKGQIVTLNETIASGATIVLDGATGTEIARLGGRMNSAAWCAEANKTHPDIVRTVHEEYIRAGADVITANTFATCRHVLAGAGLEQETVAINRRAIELACEARDNAAPGRPVWVAGSMSNMVAWIEDTVSPDPRYLPGRDEEAANYREVADIFAEAGADILLLEMMMDIDRAGLCLEAALATGLPVWVGLSCSRLPDGSLIGWDISREEQGRLADDHKSRVRLPLSEIIAGLTAMGGDVYGIMHSSIEATGPGLESLRSLWDGPIMAYPETLLFDPAINRSTANAGPEEFADACRGWVDAGVQIIGGCCGTTIEHIRAMVTALEAPREAA